MAVIRKIEIRNSDQYARKTFGDEAERQLGDALAIVNKAARELGVPVGAAAKALLDTHSVSVSGGTIALHNEMGVPLRGLGIGSTRLLIAGLQREVADKSSILLVDEVEHGLEPSSHHAPHRVARCQNNAGAATGVCDIAFSYRSTGASSPSVIGASKNHEWLASPVRSPGRCTRNTTSISGSISGPVGIAV